MIDLRATWTPTQAEFDRFAHVSGDDNPIHVDPEFSAQSGFGQTVSHGMLIFAKLWALVQAERPEAVLRRQAMMFPNPAYAGVDVQLAVAGPLPGTLVMRAWRLSDEAEVFLGEAEVEA